MSSAFVVGFLCLWAVIARRKHPFANSPATKAKQRSEIIKLRRALRESTDGSYVQAPLRPLLSPSIQSPLPEDIDDGYISEEMDDPELEGRWERLQDLVNNMQQRADKAVQMGWEEVKAPPKVLEWAGEDAADDSMEVGNISADLTPIESREGTPIE
jgi:hypothetical protein